MRSLGKAARDGEPLRRRSPARGGRGSPADRPAGAACEPGLAGGGRAGSLAGVRLTLFWDLMREQFGDRYAASLAKDHVLADLGSRTVDQALADGVEPKLIWLAVCRAFEVPEHRR